MPSDPTEPEYALPATEGALQQPDAVIEGDLQLGVENLARHFAAVAMSALVRIVRSPRDFPANSVVNAANSILDRAYGKPTQAVVQVPARQALAQRMAQMSDDDLVRLVNGEQPAALPAPEAPAQPDPQALVLKALEEAIEREAAEKEAKKAAEPKKLDGRTREGKAAARRAALHVRKPPRSAGPFGA